MPTIGAGNDSRRKLLLDGFYPFRVDKCEFRPSGNTGGSKNPLIHVEVVTEGCSNPEADGVRLYRDMALTKSAEWAVLEYLRALFGEIETDAEGNVQFDASDCLEQKGIAQVQLAKTPAGRDRNEIVSWFPSDIEFDSAGEPILPEYMKPVVVGPSSGQVFDEVPA